MPTLAYCFTLNNWTPIERQQILDINDTKVQYICLAEEVGDQGTPHLQGYIQLKKQCKYTTIKSTWPGWSRVHFEQYTVGSDDDNYDYVHGPYTKNGKNKPENPTFIEKGERITMGRKGARNDLEDVKKAIESGATYDEICETHFQQAASFSRFIKERVQARDSAKQQSSLRELYDSAVLRPWQQAIMDVVVEEACPRKIHWIWETDGNVGKSWMVNYLGAMHGATILTVGKKVDMAYIYAQKPTSIVLFDLARTNEPGEGRASYLDGVYSLAEDLKNGRVVSTKYESKTVFFRPPHVIFFANFEPDYTKWSQDRYFVTRL